MTEGSQAELYWFLLGLFFFLAELALPGFVIMFFGIGAWITALCIFLGVAEAFNTQLVMFLVSSLLTLVLFRKKGKKYFQGRVSQKATDDSTLDDLKGSKGVVIADIQGSRPGGKVEVHGTNWNAVADSDIPKGTHVEVVERRNLTLVVRPL